MSRGHQSSFRLLVKQSFTVDLSQKERLITPVIFAATFLLLFSFVLGDLEGQNKIKLFTAEVCLGLLFALQVSLARVFEPEQSDRVFDLLRTNPISTSTWFVAKYVAVVIMGLTIIVPILVFAALFNSEPNQSLFDPVILGVEFLSLLGLASIGILLCAITFQSQSKQILYPLLYFPLTIPVLLAAAQFILGYLAEKQVTEQGLQWLALLVGFDIIYFTIGTLLFGEIVAAE